MQGMLVGEKLVKSKKKIGPYLITSAIPIVMAGILKFGDLWERIAGLALGVAFLFFVWMDYFCLCSIVTERAFSRSFNFGKMRFDLHRINLNSIISIHVAKKGFVIKYQEGQALKEHGVFTQSWSNAVAFIEWFREAGVAVESPKR